MSRIEISRVEDAPGASQAMLASLESRLGTLPNMYRMMANSPVALEALLGFYASLDKGHLHQLTRERIALAVAEVSGSDYCLSAQTHRVRTAQMLDDAEITANRSGASNDIKADAAVRFAAKLARDHGQVGEADVAAIKVAGYSDGEIVEVIANVAVNLFVNTLNNALRTEIDFPRIAARHAA